MQRADQEGTSNVTRLSDYEKELLAGQHGEPRKWAMEMLLKVARIFDAEDMVEVTQVHLMADTEATGEEGVRFVEWIGSHPSAQSRVIIPTVTDPRGADFDAYKRVKQDERIVELERRADAAFRKIGIMMTDTCINYQTINPPVRGEHLAFGVVRKECNVDDRRTHSSNFDTDVCRHTTPRGSSGLARTPRAVVRADIDANTASVARVRIRVFAHCTW